MPPKPKHCQTCDTDFDGRKTLCPYCEDDIAYERDKSRRKSQINEELGGPTERVEGAAGFDPTGTAASTPRPKPIIHPIDNSRQADLERSIHALGDLSSVIFEFRDLSLSLNSRMDRMEKMVTELGTEVTAIRVAGNHNGGGAAPVNAGVSTTGGDTVGAGGGGNRNADGTLRFNFTGTSAHRFLPPILANGQGAPVSAGAAAAAVPVPGQNGGGVGDNGVVGNGAEPETVDENQPTISKFDLRRFLPAADRKKPLNVESNDKLFHLLSRLLDDLGRRGFEVSGLVAHITYLTWMASTNIYTTEALAAYDYEMRDRARIHGMGAFSGGDTNLTNMFLGASGTKQFKAGQHQGGAAGRYNNNNSNNNYQRPNYGGQNRPTTALTGWKAAASRRGICFVHAQGNPCSANCRFRHECTCGATDHNMLNCPRRGQGGQGGDRGGTGA